MVRMPMLRPNQIYHRTRSRVPGLISASQHTPPMYNALLHTHLSNHDTTLAPEVPHRALNGESIACQQCKGGGNGHPPPSSYHPFSATSYNRWRGRVCRMCAPWYTSRHEINCPLDFDVWRVCVRCVSHQTHSR